MLCCPHFSIHHCRLQEYQKLADLTYCHIYQGYLIIHMGDSNTVSWVLGMNVCACVHNYSSVYVCVWQASLSKNFTDVPIPCKTRTKSASNHHVDQNIYLAPTMHERAVFLSPANLRLILNFPTAPGVVDSAFNKDNRNLTSSLASL